jgi:7-cyano-7-deazaguanine synthase
LRRSRGTPATHGFFRRGRENLSDSIQSVVTLSGGMDSTVCAALAVQFSGAEHVAALHISYGQRTEAREQRAFTEICDRLDIQRRLMVRNQALSQIGGSALTDAALDVPIAAPGGPHPPAVGECGDAQKIPITYVPFRNAHFLSVAVSWAEVLGAREIFIGAVFQDSSGYPDCRPEYYAAFNQLIQAGTKQGDIRIQTPLIALNKAEIVTLGRELSAPFELTWSCYSRQDSACGVCESCALRLRAFAAAGIPDPISYLAPPVL